MTRSFPLAPSLQPAEHLLFTGPGGADVGSFNATINLPNPILTWTNQSAAATITRTQGVTVNWTGGAPGTT